MSGPVAERGGEASTESLPPIGAAGSGPAGTAGSVDAPPFLLPGSHFAAALGFLLAGAGGLVWVAPDLARGAFLLPRVAATAHLFTLGWITTAILGALYQFLPVALGAPIRSTRVAWTTFVLHVPGVGLLVTGLATGRTAILVAGAAALSTGLLLFAGNLALTLRNAPRGGLTWRALVAADVFLVVTLVLGSALAGNLQWGFMGGERLLALGVHLHVASLGWVLLVIVGVARHLLPMFLLSHGAPEWPGEAAFWLLTSGVGILVLGHHSPWIPVLLVAALAAGAGVAAFLLQVYLYHAHRKKPDLDPGMGLAAAGCVFLVVALVLAPGALRAGAQAPRLATAYVGAMILGGFTPFVAGHIYKILPFLTWFHRFGALVGQREVPMVADLFSAPVAKVAGGLLVGGAGVLLAGVYPLGASPMVRTGAVLFAAGAVLMAVQMTRILTRRPV